MSTVIIGSGAVASELTSYIEDKNKQTDEKMKINILGYLDSSENIEKYWRKYKLKKPVLSDIYSYQANDDDEFIIGVADVEYRKKVIEVLNKRGFKIAGFIHHSSIIADTAILGTGNIVYPNCIVGPNCTIGDSNFITSYSFISHDCTIGNNNFFSTAGLGGRCSVGNDNFFGIRSTVLPDIAIGSNNTIQAGMVIDKDITDNSTVFYRYKEKIIAVPKS